MTILPILRPNARVSERSPLAVGCASRTTPSSDEIGCLAFLVAAISVDATGDDLRDGLVSGDSSLAMILGGGWSSSSASTIVFLTPLLLTTTVFLDSFSSPFATQFSESESVLRQGFGGPACDSALAALFTSAPCASASSSAGTGEGPFLCSFRTSMTSRGGSDLREA